MKIDILTLFPEMFASPLSSSIIKRAQDKKIVEISLHNLRQWTTDKRGTVDGRPYGGGPGMIMMVGPIDKALHDLRSKTAYVILLDPTGKVFDQKLARKLSRKDHLIFVCGHYEGIDERVKEHFVDEIISIGDFILTGGELPAIVIVDSLTRLLPGVLGKKESSQDESFTTNTLEYPQYTRPEIYKNWKVPPILLSGDHSKIEQWHTQQSHQKTKKNRPDLL